MANRVDVATLEARLQVVDSQTRRGLSVHEIAELFFAEEAYHHLLGDDLADAIRNALIPQKRYQVMMRLRKLVKKDISVIRVRFHREINPADTEESLSELISRLDHLYRQAVHTYTDSFDARDKINALRTARELAHDKAKVLGVDLEPADRGKELEGAAKGMATMAEFVRLAAQARLPAPPMEALTAGSEFVLEGNLSEGELLAREYDELLGEDDNLNAAS